MRATVRRITARNTFIPEVEFALADDELAGAPVAVPVDDAEARATRQKHDPTSHSATAAR